MVGRKAEIELLNQLQYTNKAELVIVYGRRRVGKTFLIREHFKNDIILEFVGSEKENTATQLANFNTIFEEECTAKYKQAASWSEAFTNLAKHLKTLPKSKKAVVFIDEFPWLDKPQSGFLGAFEYFWNQHASKMKHLIFVVCGSMASWIIKNLINNYGGLHNRETLTLEIKPFNLQETEEFLKNKNLKYTQYQILQLYMAIGGIPYYLDLVPNAKSVAQAIDKLFFAPSALLAKEFNNLFKSLFKKPQAFISIVNTLANHHYGIQRSQIISESQLAAGGSFNRTMQTLEECGFITKLQPFGKKNREATYKLIDFFCIFYSRFVLPKKSLKVSSWQVIANTDSYKIWCGYAYENICLQHLPQLQSSLGIEGVYTEISAWQIAKNKETGGAQIDLIINRKDGIIHLCEVKFTHNAFITTASTSKNWANKRAVFQHHSNTKSLVVTTFIGTYKPMQNKYFKDEVHSTILMDAFF